MGVSFRVLLEKIRPMPQDLFYSALEEQVWRRLCSRKHPEECNGCVRRTRCTASLLLEAKREIERIKAERKQLRDRQDDYAEVHAGTLWDD